MTVRSQREGRSHQQSIEGAASPLAVQSSSPQHREQTAADSSPHDHHRHHHHHHHPHRPASHLASGQSPLGRQITEVTLQKEGDKGIGLTIVGGETTSSLDLGIFVKSVLKDGPAARTGQIQAGDRLIAINGVSLEGVQHHEAVQLIRQAEEGVHLLLSQMHPPTSLCDNNAAACRHHQDDLSMRTDGRFPPDQSENIPSVVFNTDSSRLSAFPYRHGPADSLDLTDSGTLELEKCSVPGGLPGLDSSTVTAGAGDEDFFPEEMLAATDFDSHDLRPGNTLETESDKEIQELHILGEIVSVTVNNSDTDSDFESAVQATVEGKVHKSSSFKASQNASPPWKGDSISSPDMVVYEVLLEKDQGTLGIILHQDEEDSSLCVQSLVPGGPAEAGGILQQGDCLLELNGRCMRGVSSSAFEKALMSAPNVCLMKIGRTKSMDDAALAKLPQQLNKGPGSSDKRPCSRDVPVDHVEPWNDSAGPECQISPPAAFASMAASPAKPIPSAPVIPPPPQLPFDVPSGEDEHSNNTQSDVDSDVLDSSRSELELAYKSAENYLKNNSDNLEIDDIVELECMNMGVHKSDDELDDVNIECMSAGVNTNKQNADQARRSADARGEEPSHVSFQDGSCGATATSLSATPLASSAPPADRVAIAPHLAGPAPCGHSVQQGMAAADSLKKRNASVAFAETANIGQVEEMTVKLTKSVGGGLGFTVVGGVTTTGGCYVKAVLQDPALSDGTLRAGDRLIQVNGQDMTGLSHFEAVTFLRQTGKEVSIKIHRCQGSSKPVVVSPPHQAGENGPPSHPKKACPVEPKANFSERPVDCPPDCAEDRGGDAPRAVIRPYSRGQHSTSAQHVEGTHSAQLDHAIAQTDAGVLRVVLGKSELRDSLGFSLIQRPTERGPPGIFINRLTPGGIAQTDGHLRAGDQLLQVNGESLTGSSHTKAVQLLRKAPGSVELTIFRHSGDQTNPSDGQIIPTDTSHRSIEGPKITADDDGCEVLDEAAELFDHEFRDIPNAKQTEVKKQDSTMHSKSRDLRTFDQVQMNTPTTIGQAELDMQSSSETDCKASNVLQLPSHGEVTGLSDPTVETHAEMPVTERGYVRKVSSPNMPAEPTTDLLLSLPVLRMRTGTEERTVHLLERLADAVEQEEPLLEFEKLRLMKATDNMEVAKCPENKTRNRYRNVLPYDYNRVKLQESSAESSDYINASSVQLSVKGEKGPLRYIVCQGPLPATQDHFWQMAWEQGVSVVVMLTQEVESGKVKCHRYWPHASEQPLGLSNGRHSVRLEKEENLGDFDVRHLTMRDHVSGEERRVKQLHYTTWPDHGVPDSAYPLLQFSQLMHQLHQGGPFVVHCSAGIGRSGVLIAVDTALARIETGDELDLFDIVSELRHQRYGMIQTQDQYLFCYTACMEALLTRDQ